MTDKYHYYYGSAGITLSTAQQSELRMLFNTTNKSNLSKLGLAVPLYDKLLSFLPAPASANTGYAQVYKWIEGARDVNANDGVFATFIRNYTVNQYTLRFGDETPEAFILDRVNVASNTIGLTLIRSILANNGVLPSIEGIGAVDGGESARMVFASSYYLEGDYTGWAGALLFSYLGYDRFFYDWLLNQDDVSATIHGGGVPEIRIIKNHAGTYDLMTSLAATQETINSLSTANKIEAFWNKYFGGTIDTDQDNLVHATNLYVEEYYDLYNIPFFKAGEKLPYLGIWGNIDEFLNGELGVKVGTVYNDKPSKFAASIDEKLYRNYIIHAGDGNDKINAYINEIVGYAPYGNVLFDGGAGIDFLDYSITAYQQIRIHITLEEIYGTGYDWRYTVAKHTDLSTPWGYDFNYSIENLKATNEADVLSITTTSIGDEVLYIDLGNGGTLGNTLSLSTLNHGAYIFASEYGSQLASSTGVGGIIMRHVDNLIGSVFDDELYGDGLSNIIDGGYGNNYMSGGGGSDTFIIGLGNNTIADAEASDKLAIRLPGGSSSAMSSSALVLGGGFIMRSNASEIGATVELGVGDTAIFYPVNPNPLVYTPALGGAQEMMYDYLGEQLLVSYSRYESSLKIQVKMVYNNQQTVSETTIQGYKPGDLGLQFKTYIVPNYSNGMNNQADMKDIITDYVSSHEELLQNWVTVPLAGDLWYA